MKNPIPFVLLLSLSFLLCNCEISDHGRSGSFEGSDATSEADIAYQGTSKQPRTLARTIASLALTKYVPRTPRLLNKTDSLPERLLLKASILNLVGLLSESVHVNNQESYRARCDQFGSGNGVYSDSGSMEGTAEAHNEKAICEQVMKRRCLSIDQLIKLLSEQEQLGENDENEEQVLSRVFGSLCPLLLFQNQDPHCSISSHLSQDSPAASNYEIHAAREPSSTEVTERVTSGVVAKRLKPSPAAVWGFGFLFVTIVSCCSLVGVALLPFLSKELYHNVIVLFEGLAVGSLVSSALFHLIPQAFGLLGEDAEHRYLWKSLIIFGGIYLFFLSERGLKIIIQRKESAKSKKDNAEVSSMSFTPSEISSNELKINGNAFKSDMSSSHPLELVTMPTSNHFPLEIDTEACLDTKPSTLIPHGHNHHEHSHAISFRPCSTSQEGHPAKQVIATVAWMVIFGDGLHNFIDGLSMGAAFSESILSGISISVAVICEEFPHELGDFAVLLSAGMTMKQALMYNFLSACTCYLGLVFGVLLGDLAEGGPYIFALAGGMFLYISLVDMVGELSHEMEEASHKGTKEMLKTFALQNIGILLGVALLFLMARYSEKINFKSFSSLEPIEASKFISTQEQAIISTITGS